MYSSCVYFTMKTTCYCHGNQRFTSHYHSNQSFCTVAMETVTVQTGYLWRCSWSHKVATSSLVNLHVHVNHGAVHLHFNLKGNMVTPSLHILDNIHSLLNYIRQLRTHVIGAGSALCCRLYCYKRVTRATMPMATNEWYFVRYSLVLRMVIMILSYEPSISSQTQCSASPVPRLLSTHEPGNGASAAHVNTYIIHTPY